MWWEMVRGGGRWWEVVGDGVMGVVGVVGVVGSWEVAVAIPTSFWAISQKSLLLKACCTRTPERNYAPSVPSVDRVRAYGRA